MSRRKDTFAEAIEKAQVKPLDYTPSVGKQRHLTLTLPNSHYSGCGGGRLTMALFTCPECENGDHLVGYARAIVRGAVNPTTGKVKEAWTVDFADADAFPDSVSCDVHRTAEIVRRDG